jgi:hypothetical protein
MKRIGTPTVGGIIASTFMELAVYPAIFYLWRPCGLKPAEPEKSGEQQIEKQFQLNSCAFWS